MIKRGLGRRQYLKIIANALNDAYGDTLIEGGTDLEMAKTVFRRLKKHLKVGPADMSVSEFKAWRRREQRRLMGLSDEEIDEYESH